MTYSIYSVGSVVAGEGSLEIYPTVTGNRPGVQSVHGAGSDATYCIATDGNQSTLTDLIAQAGFTAISGDNGGPAAWGNSIAVQSVNAYTSRLQGMAGVTPGKIALIGSSMGGLTSLNFAAANPSKVSCIVAIIPVINLTDIYTNNRLGFAASILAAYGGGYSEADYGPTRNPLTEASLGKLAGIPMLFFYGLTDALCLPQFTEQFAAYPGMNVTLVPLPSGHDFTSYGLVDHPQVVQFLNDHA